MLILDAEKFVTLLQALFSAEQVVRGRTGTLPTDQRARLVRSAEAIKKQCLELELVVSARTATNMLSSAETVERAHESVRQLKNTIMIELQGRQFYGPLSRYLQYYGQSALFGGDVFNKFSTANDDIYEAGMCLALERSTACVMHLMRVLEVGLAALAGQLGIANQNDWGAYIREIPISLDKKAKSSGSRSPDEQFYAESAASFDRLRRAFRNPTMHADRTYSQERAEEILLATKSFMTLLATRISE